MMITMANYVTVAEAARELGVTERAIHKRIAAGLMRAERFGAHVWQIPVEEVRRWREIGRMKPGPKPGTKRQKEQPS